MENKPKRQPQVRVTEIRETDIGLYVWEMPNGAIVANEDLEYLSVPSRIHDVRRIAALRDAVKSLGIEEGKPLFMPGARQITRSEWEDQMERMKDGKIPDPADPGNREGVV